MVTTERLAESRLSPTEAARLIGVNVSTVWRWCQKGIDGVKLKMHRIGGRRCIFKSDLDSFLAANSGGTGGNDQTAPPVPVATGERL